MSDVLKGSLRYLPTSDRERLIETIRIELNPSKEGVVRECFREVARVIRAVPFGTFSDENASADLSHRSKKT